MTREEIEALTGRALADAVAEEVMGWEPVESKIGAVRWRAPGGELRNTAVPYEGVLSRLLSWRPDYNMDQAIEIMSANSGWFWTLEEIGSVADRLVRASIQFASEEIASTYVRVREWRDHAYGTAICRAALLAVQRDCSPSREED